MLFARSTFAWSQSRASRPSLPYVVAMANQRSAIGLFGMFGRSSDLRQLDDALRAVDVHPRLISEAVKLTAVKLLKEDAGGREPHPDAYRSAAALVAYCAVGVDGFAEANGDGLAMAVDERIGAALQSGGNLDAQLLLLMLHSGAMQPSVRERHQLEIAPE